MRTFLVRKSFFTLLNKYAIFEGAFTIDNADMQDYP